MERQRNPIQIWRNRFDRNCFRLCSHTQFIVFSTHFSSSLHVVTLSRSFFVIPNLTYVKMSLITFYFIARKSGSSWAAPFFAIRFWIRNGEKLLINRFEYWYSMRLLPATSPITDDPKCKSANFSSDIFRDESTTNFADNRIQILDENFSVFALLVLFYYARCVADRKLLRNKFIVSIILGSRWKVAWKTFAIDFPNLIFKPQLFRLRNFPCCIGVNFRLPLVAFHPRLNFNFAVWLVANP